MPNCYMKSTTAFLKRQLTYLLWTQLFLLPTHAISYAQEHGKDHAADSPRIVKSYRFLVKDENDAPVAGAGLQVRNTMTGVRTTDESGQVTILGEEGNTVSLILDGTTIMKTIG